MSQMLAAVETELDDHSKFDVLGKKSSFVPLSDLIAHEILSSKRLRSSVDSLYYYLFMLVVLFFFNGFVGSHFSTIYQHIRTSTNQSETRTPLVNRAVDQCPLVRHIALPRYLRLYLGIRVAVSMLLLIYWYFSYLTSGPLATAASHPFARKRVTTGR